MVDSAAKLRILHIAETYPPSYGGGAAIFVRDVCRLMAARGHEVAVLCTDSADGEEYSIHAEHDEAVRVYRVNLPYFRTIDPEGWLLHLGRWRRHERRIVKLVEDVIASWMPDVVHYHTCRPFGEEPLAMLQRRRVPVVAMLHDAWLICPRVMLLRSPTIEACSGPTAVRCLGCLYSEYDGSRMRAALKLPWRAMRLGLYPAYRLWRRTRARRAVREAIAYSRFMAEVHAGHLGGPVRYLQIGIDLNGLPAVRPNRPRSPLRFGFVAGFQGTKGIWSVLDSSAALKRRGFTFELHVWGPGTESGMGDIAARELADRVFLHGMFSSEDKWKAYDAIDVAIMATTVCEPLGRVPIEAAASGAPTIAPAVGGIPEIVVHEENGLLYRFRDAQDLERQMQRVLEEPELVRRLLRNVHRSESVDNVASALEAFYLRIAGKGALAAT